MFAPAYFAPTFWPRTMFPGGASGGTTPTVVTSYDATFLAGLNSVVAVQVDLNASAATTGQHSGVAASWAAVAGLETLACRLVAKSSDPRLNDSKPGVTRSWRVLLGRSVMLDRRHRLLYADPDLGRTTYLVVQSATRNAHQMDHHWIVDCIEYLQ